MDNSIYSHPHHNFFVELKFLFFWKLKKTDTIEFSYKW